MHQKLTVSEIPCPDWPLETLGISITAGSPKGSGNVTYQTPDKLVSGGVWGCSPGTFELTFGWDEMSYLLEGEIVIEEGGRTTHHCSTGRLSHVPQGNQEPLDRQEGVHEGLLLEEPRANGLDRRIPRSTD